MNVVIDYGRGQNFQFLGNFESEKKFDKNPNKNPTKNPNISKSTKHLDTKFPIFIKFDLLYKNLLRRYINVNKFETWNLSKLSFRLNIKGDFTLLRVTINK